MPLVRDCAFDHGRDDAPVLEGAGIGFGVKEVRGGGIEFQGHGQLSM